ncbi:MAG TPA: SIS domain-containing protein [Steroidobacteraceae bacterium]|nr:SIS domain-containing protein [Steroidobacteraceae bacterium]
MEALGLSAAQIHAAGADWTAREIAQQPQIWPQVVGLVAADAALARFLAPLLGDPQLHLVLTGAGTSSFIGECLAPALLRNGARHAAAVPTTDIVASPASTLAPGVPTLMVHFSRSGNSPESVAALELAEQRIGRCAHLIVTCNREGDLYQRVGSVRSAHAVLLPVACNDQSFAMTSSFSGMLLAAAVALRLVPADGAHGARLARLGAQVLTSCLAVLSALVRAEFDRVVYLGSNELKGLAREAALKMLELTDGKVVSVGEAPLGLRHGPKTLLNDSTLVVAFLSNDAHTRRYDLDLVAELRREAVAGRVIALANRPQRPEHCDTLVLAEEPAAAADGAAGERSNSLSDLELCLPYVVFAQALATLRSLSLGLSPDNPNAAGTVNRVVQGVSIYPFGGAR